MRNLYNETVEVLERNGKSIDHVEYVTNGNVANDWATFAKTAKGFNYDSGFGQHYVTLNLKVVGSGWWMERSEYDGAEGWDFKTMPTHPGINTPNAIVISATADYNMI